MKEVIMPSQPKFLNTDELRAFVVKELARDYRRHPAFDMMEKIAQATHQADTNPLLHGAVRVGNFKEANQVIQIAAALGLTPVNAYALYPELPIVGTGLCAPDNSFRIFVSTLVPDYLKLDDDGVKQEVIKVIDERQLFNPKLLVLADKAKKEGGLTESDAKQFCDYWTDAVHESKKTPVSKELYEKLLASGSDVAADILWGINWNHMTPETNQIELAHEYLKDIFALANKEEYEEAIAFYKERIGQERFDQSKVTVETLKEMVEKRKTLPGSEGLEMIDIQGPPVITINHHGEPVKLRLLLNQTSFKAVPLTIKVQDAQGNITERPHMASFGEMEANGVALKEAGRQLIADKKKTNEVEDVFPKTLEEAVDEGLIYVTYALTEKGRTHKTSNGVFPTTWRELVEQEYIECTYQPYVQFLDKSAAGIFHANLSKSEDKKGKPSSVPAKKNPYLLLSEGGIEPQKSDDIFEQREVESKRKIVNELGITIGGMQPIAPSPEVGVDTTTGGIAGDQQANQLGISKL